jgi:hypothetical protein
MILFIDKFQINSAKGGPFRVVKRVQLIFPLGVQIADLKTLWFVLPHIIYREPNLSLGGCAIAGHVLEKLVVKAGLF